MAQPIFPFLFQLNKSMNYISFVPIFDKWKDSGIKRDTPEKTHRVMFHVAGNSISIHFRKEKTNFTIENPFEIIGRTKF